MVNITSSFFIIAKDMYPVCILVCKVSFVA